MGENNLMINDNNYDSADFNSGFKYHSNINIEGKKTFSFFGKVKCFFGITGQKCNIQTTQGIFTVRIEEFSKKELEKQRGSGNSTPSPPVLGIFDKYIRGFRIIKLGNNYIKIDKKSFLAKFSPRTEHEKQILKNKGSSHYIEFKIRKVIDNELKKSEEKEIGDKNKFQKHTLSGMDLSRVQEKYIDLKSQNLVPDLDSSAIAHLFQKELRKGEAIENTLHLIFGKLGIRPNDFPDEVENLTILFLLARNMPEQANRDIMRSALFALIQIVKENNPPHENDLLKEKKKFLDQFDFSEEIQISLIQSPNNFQLADLIYLQNILPKPSSLFLEIIKDEINSALKDPCLAQFNFLCEELKQPTSLGDEQVLKKCLSIMAILNFLSKNLPVNDETEKEWGNLFYLFKEALNIKRTSKNPSIQEQLNKAFEQYQTLIEDGFIAYKLKVHGGSAEQVTKFLYGRSDQEIEHIKSRNREKVVEVLTEYSDQVKKGNPITIKMLSSLHAMYNRGIVPRYLSQLRKREHENIQFGKRVGIIPKHVEPAVQEVLDKANQLIKNPPKSKLLYSIQVAKLHNRLLDIHPFLDRNGSTSLLFIELLMAVNGGYNPPKNRIKNYNANLFKILKNSLAVAIVSYEHYKIAHQFGYYKSKLLRVDKPTLEYYKYEIAKQKLRYKSESTLEFLSKVWENFKKIYKSAN